MCGMSCKKSDEICDYALVYAFTDGLDKFTTG